MTEDSSPSLELSIASTARDLAVREWHPLGLQPPGRLERALLTKGWMPYAIDEALADLDIAEGMLERGDEAAVRESLSHQPLRARLVDLAGEVLGSGDLVADDYSAARALTRIALDDVCRLVALAALDHPELRGLSGDLERERALRDLRHRFAPLLSEHIRVRPGESYLDAVPTTFMHGMVDLAVVPPRVFPWSGPDVGEITAVRSAPDTPMTIEVPLRGGAVLPSTVAFVIDSGGLRWWDAPMRQVDGVALAEVVLDADATPLAVGIRAEAVDAQHAVSRVLTGEVEATRCLIESWARQRLGLAALATQEEIDREGSPERHWLELSPAEPAARGAEILGTHSRLVFAGRSGSAVRLREDARRYAVDRGWDGRVDLTGADRPLLAELGLVLGLTERLGA